MEQMMVAINRWYVKDVQKTITNIVIHDLLTSLFSTCHGYIAPSQVERTSEKSQSHFVKYV